MAAAAALLLTISLLPFLSSAASSDSINLIALKESFSNPTSLSSWTSTTSPCDRKSPWAGIICFNDIITGLRLESMSLSGEINVEALTKLTSLRAISFRNNSFSGPIPPFHRLDALKSFYLNDNKFSGPIPDEYFANMDHLKKLHLGNNEFTGPIPSSISNLKTLIDLHLEGNRFSGPIPENLGAKFGTKSFSGNPELCGRPLARCEIAATPPPPPHDPGHGKAIMIVIVIMLLAVLIIAVASVKCRQDGDCDTLGIDNTASTEAGEAKKVKSSRKSLSGGCHRSSKGSGGMSTAKGSGGGGGGPGDLVMVNEEKGVFGMSDLMKASAEVLGNGGLGSAYKAVMGNGMAVAVKRLRDMNRVEKETFDAEMRRLGRLKHKNVLTPLAYHYRKEEKLLIFEYIPKGSLLYVLHGSKGPDHKALDWPTRMTIIVGIARGMAHLHTELNSLDIPHGNLKSGNVLLASDFEPLLIDYGFVPMINPSTASHTMFAYKSPESLAHRHVCFKSDVYCLGIVILEVLTGKFPSQYLNNTKGGTDVVEWSNAAIKEDRVSEVLDPAIASANSKSAVANMELLIRTGVDCVVADLDLRPSMKEAWERIEEVVTKARKDFDSDGGGGGGPAEVSPGNSHAMYVREGSITDRSQGDVPFAIS